MSGARILDLELIGAPAFAFRPVGDRFEYVALNKRLEILTGLSSADMVGRTPAECLPPAIAERIVGRLRQCVESREAVEYEERYDLPGGSRCWAVTVTPVIDQLTHRVTVLLGVAADITRRHDLEAAAAEATARLTLAMDVIDGGFWLLDITSGTFRTSLPLATLVAGEGSPELGLEQYLSYIEVDDLPAADLSALVMGFQEENVAEYRVKTFAGETRWMRCKRRLVRDQRGHPSRVVGVAIDVTEQKALQSRYKQQATTDLLTGLANRRSLEVRAQERMLLARRTGAGMGLMLLDLDRFKPVNDRFGHAGGDAVLREVAERLQGLSRDQDLVARFGGDEFAILLDDVDAGMLPRLTRSVVRALSKPFQIDGQVVKVGVSIGATALEDADVSIDDLALRADRALYDMKKAGRRRWTSAA